MTLPMPAPVVLDGVRLPASYANFYVANAVVLVPTFNDARDREALGTLARRCSPTRAVVGIHAVDLVWGLGTLHCMTQQQPAGGHAAPLTPKWRRRGSGLRAGPSQCASIQASESGLVAQRPVERLHGVVGARSRGRGVGARIQDPVRELEVVEERREAVRPKARARPARPSASAQARSAVPASTSSARRSSNARSGAAGHALEQAREGRLVEAGLLGGLGHDGDLARDEVAVGRRREEPSDEVEVERARDGLGEKQRRGRVARPAARPARAARAHDVVERRVRDDVGRDVLVGQHARLFGARPDRSG